MSDLITLRLPGHNFNPLAERKCLLSLLAAYSRQWNPRNLEAPWYEAWSQILADLVAAHPSLSIAPQPYLWHDPTSQPYTTPGPAHLLSTNDEQLDEVHDDVGNTTLSSIRSISIPSHRNRNRIPDFAIIRRVSFFRPNNASQVVHLDRRVTYLGYPLLAELKSSGTRCHDIQTSMTNAIKPMNLARDQLFRQAYHLFQMYPHQQSVLLFATSGFWWSYFIYPRALLEDLPLEDGDDDDDDDDEGMGLEDDTVLHTQNGIHSVLLQDPRDSAETPNEVLREHLYGFLLSTFRNDLEPTVRFHTMLPHSKVTLSEDGWSDYLLYGTASSNQVLSLILDRLHSVVHVHYDGKMG